MYDITTRTTNQRPRLGPPEVSAAGGWAVVALTEHLRPQSAVGSPTRPQIPVQDFQEIPF